MNVRRRIEPFEVANPYEPPPSSEPLDSIGTGRLLAVSYTLAAYAVIIGWQHLPQFLTSPIASWNWQNWWFGFAPAAYLLFASVIAVYCERKRSRFGLTWIPLVLLPLLAVTALVLFALYLDFGNVIRGNYGWTQNAYYLLIASLCPVVWYYLAASLYRSWRLINSTKLG